jgi:hypothetical protein
MSRQDEQRGTRRMLFGASVIAIALLAAVLIWVFGFSPGVITGRNIGSGHATATVPRSNQVSGASGVGKLGASGVPENSTSEKVQAIDKSAHPIELTQQQRDQIRSYFAGRSTARTDHATFTLSVGAAVPKQVDLQNLPPALSTILRGYEGDKYLLVKDELVVVDSQSRRVDAIVPGVG